MNCCYIDPLENVNQSSQGKKLLVMEIFNTKAEVAAVKKEEVDSCEMENSEVRFYDVRSSKGRLPFLAKVCFGKGYFMC